VVELATSAETTAGLAVQASDTRLSDARTPTAHGHSPNDITVSGASLIGKDTPGEGLAINVTCTAAGFAILDDATAGDQRTTLGLGTLATQDAATVAITGGAISGVTLSASSVTATGLTSGRIPVAGTGGLLGNSPVYTDGTKVGIGATALLGKLTVRESDTGAVSFTDFSTFAPASYAANGPIGGIRLGWKYLTAAPNNVELQAIRGADADDGAGLGIFTSTSNALDAVERVRVTSSGNVGIGTPTPQSRLDIAGGALEMAEMTAPAAPAANGARLYLEDNGSGKTRLVVKFASGAAIVLATEP
jgi:hypothetical protein